MSSNLKVNTILPSTGSNIGIGTNGGELNVDGGCKVQVGTALTLGHSIGLQYATQNLHSTGFEINQINASGIITASSYRGDGSQLTGITGTTINNNANDRIITGSGTANTLNGEANLKYADTHLQVGGQSNLGSHNATITLSNRGSSARSAIEIEGNTANCHAALDFRNNGTLVSALNSRGSDRLQFCTGSSGNVKAEVTGDNFKITDGNLIIGTAGHGIDFSADGNASGMSNELLDDYEEGSWTATTPHSGSNTGCRYVKVGNMCLITGSIGNISNSSSSILEISGLPFNQRNSGVSGQVPYLGALRGYNLGTNGGNGRPPTTIVIENSKIYVGAGQGNGGWDMLQYNELGSSSNAIQFNVCYQTA